ncbi:MAG: hypothetical protein ACM3SO_01005 [Betaproteobacteria bacterium]
MSEMRRAARALVERRTERFESAHDLGTSQRRLAGALERARLAPDPTFRITWLEGADRPVLEASFLPARRTVLLLRMLSLAMLGLLVSTVWVLTQTQEGTSRFLLPLFTVLAILALPFVTLGLASSREAREARIRKAIRVALKNEDERFPPAQRWPDED